MLTAELNHDVRSKVAESCFRGKQRRAGSSTPKLVGLACLSYMIEILAQLKRTPADEETRVGSRATSVGPALVNKIRCPLVEVKFATAPSLSAFGAPAHGPTGSVIRRLWRLGSAATDAKNTEQL